jgi:hypothetical protein
VDASGGASFLFIWVMLADCEGKTVMQENLLFWIYLTAWFWLAVN